MYALKNILVQLYFELLLAYDNFHRETLIISRKSVVFRCLPFSFESETTNNQQTMFLTTFELTMIQVLKRQHHSFGKLFFLLFFPICYTVFLSLFLKKNRLLLHLNSCFSSPKLNFNTKVVPSRCVKTKKSRL